MKNTAQTAQIRSIPAPIRGLSSEVPLAMMHPTDAIILENVVCRPGAVEVRKGWQDWVTGFTSTVETLFPYQSLSGSGDKLFAAAGTAIYEVTSNGSLGPAAVTGLTSAYWAQTQLSNVAGNYLIIVNGVDTGRTFDGTTWANWAITGVASTAISQVAVWKRRVWGVEKNTTKAWYSAADAIAGAMTAFSLSGIFRRGGKLAAIVPWTIDAGAGVDDHLLFISTEGEIAVYKGTDPASAATFSLQGLYYIGAPVGSRFWAQVGGDVWMLTVSGLVSFSSFLQSAVLDKSSVRTDRIRRLILADIASYGSTQGWEVVYFPEENFIFLQVPAGVPGSRYQWVMNTLTGAWSKCLQERVVTYAVHNGALYAGHSSEVSLAWTGGLDDGSPIEYRVIPAFSTFGSGGQGKQFTLGRVLMEADYLPTYRVKLLRDYDTNYSIPAFSPSPTSSAVWDTAIWDASLWGGYITVYNYIYSLTGFCRAASLAFEGISSGSIVRFVSFEYTFIVGGPL